jgi:hypothetical protein
MKMCPAGPEKFRVDGQTGTMKLTVTFCILFNAPKMDCAGWGMWHEWGREKVHAAIGPGTCRTRTCTIHVKVCQAQFWMAE